MKYIIDTNRSEFMKKSDLMISLKQLRDLINEKLNNLTKDVSRT